MNKIILISLVIFFAICSRSWAKVEIWECDIYDRGEFDAIYKIDTSIPMVYIRRDGIWNAFYQNTPSYIIEYSEEQDSIWWTNINGNKFQVFDLILKQNIFINPKTGDTNLIISCSVRR